MYPINNMNCICNLTILYVCKFLVVAKTIPFRWMRSSPLATHTICLCSARTAYRHSSVSYTDDGRFNCSSKHVRIVKGVSHRAIDKWQSEEWSPRLTRVSGRCKQAAIVAVEVVVCRGASSDRDVFTTNAQL